jgi:hypothetical protein
MDEPQETGMKLGDALRFVVRLGQQNASTLSRGALLVLVDGLRKYLNVVGAGKIDRELRQAEKHPERLAPAIAVAGQLTEAIADRRKIQLKYDEGMYVIDVSKGRKPRALEDTSLRDAVLHFATADIDDEEQALRIGRCPRCREIFYGQPNAKFCSRRCASAEAVARYRAGKTKAGQKKKTAATDRTPGTSEQRAQ